MIDQMEDCFDFRANSYNIMYYVFLGNLLFYDYGRWWNSSHGTGSGSASSSSVFLSLGILLWTLSYEYHAE